DGAVPAGAYGCWRLGISEKWHVNNVREFTADKRAAYTVHMQEIRNQRAAEEIKRHAAAAQQAERIWSTARPAPPDHVYLSAKGVRPHGLRVSAGSVVVPMRNSGLHSLQFISGDGTKRFLPGGRVAGCCFSIGKLNGVLCIAEGFATGASIYESTGHAAAIVFTVGNLLAIAKAARAKYPDTKIVLCADDDVATPGNPGLTKATEAALVVSGRVALPDFGADRPDGVTDFNDLHRLKGARAVQVCIEGACQVEMIS
ncbi:MAG TPA: toprim domain-containing protein, partial [Gammaproteobacteria bacterium]|nr:toprim domain-containing protein [Gammaproteobacteria bacterium]